MAKNRMISSFRGVPYHTGKRNRFIDNHQKEEIMEKVIAQLQEKIMALGERLGDAENKIWRSEEKIKELESQIDWLEKCMGDIDN